MSESVRIKKRVTEEKVIVLQLEKAEAQIVADALTSYGQLYWLSDEIDDAIKELTR
jgi:hypothetical protein